MTGRSKQQTELTLSHQTVVELYRAILEQSTDGIFIANPQGRYVEVNRRACELLGYSREELLSLSIPDVIPVEDQAADPPRLADLRAGKALFTQRRLRCRDGQLLPVEIRAQRLADGHLLGLVRDMGERQRAEQALRASEEKYRQLFAEMANGCALHELICDEAGRAVDYVTLEINQAYEALLNTHRDQVIGRRASEVLPPEELQHWLEIFGPVALSGHSVRYELYSPLNQRYFEGSAYCPEKGKFAVTFADITERKQVEAALYESETRFRMIFEQAAVGIAQVELETGRFVRMNEKYCQIVGYSPEELWTKTFQDLTYPDDLPADLSLMARLLAGEIPTFTLEKRYLHKNGSTVWVNLTVSLMETINQKPRFNIAIVEDITERKQMEAALRLSSERLSLALAAAQAGTWEWELGTNENIWSKELWVLYGLEPDSCQPSYEAWRQTIHPADRARVEQTVQVATGKGTDLNTEWRVTGHDGTERWLMSRGRPWRDATGRVSRYLGIVLDITARKQTEAALRESEERYRTLFEQAHEAIHVANAADEIVDVNHRACQLFGYSREELLARHVSDLQAPHLRGSTGSVVKNELSRHGNTAFETIDIRRDGTLIPVEVSVARVVRPGGDLYISIVRDISERKRAEAAQARLEAQLRQAQKMESIGRLAGGVAHDFNNLLTVIQGHSSLVQAGMSVEDPFFHDLDQIRQAGERAAALTRQLLAFSRQQVLAPTVLDLNSLVTNLHKMLKRLIGEDVTLSLALQPGLRPVTADPGQLEQVIMNLVVNARDAMPTGGMLTIETSHTFRDESYASPHPGAPVGPGVLLTVTDTGYGMDEAMLGQIFEPFFTTKEVGQGTGLGLATVYGIVKQSGGDITVTSEPGQGTTFKIYLPAGETAIVPVAPSAPQPTRQGGSETILLVEDDELVRHLVRVVLQAEGYMILEARQGNEALTLVEQQPGPIDLLLTDVIMPGMSGRELAEQLKRLRPPLKVLFMSGYTDDTVIRHGLLAAEVEFLPKPFSSDLLVARVRQVLDR